MKIEDMPRPWLLAAMTGVPMSALLEQAERERAERAKVARRNAVRADYWRSRAVIRRPGKAIESARLAS
jgi:hypothetical protein